MYIQEPEDVSFRRVLNQPRFMLAFLGTFAIGILAGLSINMNHSVDRTASGSNAIDGFTITPGLVNIPMHCPTCPPCPTPEPTTTPTTTTTTTTPPPPAPIALPMCELDYATNNVKSWWNMTGCFGSLLGEYEGHFKNKDDNEWWIDHPACTKMYKQYNRDDIINTFKGSKFYFMGNSITRGTFMSFRSVLHDTPELERKAAKEECSADKGVPSCVTSHDDVPSKFLWTQWYNYTRINYIDFMPDACTPLVNMDGCAQKYFEDAKPQDFLFVSLGLQYLSLSHQKYNPHVEMEDLHEDIPNFILAIKKHFPGRVVYMLLSKVLPDAHIFNANFANGYIYQHIKPTGWPIIDPHKYLRERMNQPGIYQDVMHHNGPMTRVHINLLLNIAANYDKYIPATEYQDKHDCCD